MISIKAPLSSDDFIKLHSENKHVKPFSKEATEAILANIAELQKEGFDDGSDWEQYFAAADEFTPLELVADHSQGLDEMADDIMTMVQCLSGIPRDLLTRIEDESALSGSELINKLKPELEALDGWGEGVCEVISSLGDAKVLSNGNYIVL